MQMKKLRVQHILEAELRLPLGCSITSRNSDVEGEGFLLLFTHTHTTLTQSSRGFCFRQLRALQPHVPGCDIQQGNNSKGSLKPEM